MILIQYTMIEERIECSKKWKEEVGWLEKVSRRK